MAMNRPFRSSIAVAGLGRCGRVDAPDRSPESEPLPRYAPVTEIEPIDYWRPAPAIA